MIAAIAVPEYEVAPLPIARMTRATKANHMRRRSILVLLLLCAGCPCLAIERPPYKVETSEKPFEIRDYAPTIVATVRVNGSRDDAVNAGFRIVAGYIFGDNQTETKIEMTAPVSQVRRETTPGGWDVLFTMPAVYTMDTLPTPRDARVHLVQLPGRRLAVITFSGFWSDSNFQSHQTQLRNFLAKKHLTAKSAPIYAYYNPPWTPWFLRTNEVLVELAPSSP